MNGYRVMRYRLYPTADEECELLAQEAALREIWNLLLEHRLFNQYSRASVLRVTKRGLRYRGYPCGKMTREVTELLNHRTDLRCAARTSIDAVTRRHELAWERYWKASRRRPIGASGRRWRGYMGAPRFKTQNDSVGIRFQIRPGEHPIIRAGLRCPLFWEPLRIVMDCPLPGRPTHVELVREVDQWFAHVCCAVEISPEPIAGPVVGIDLGVRYTISDSDGRMVPRPEWIATLNARIATAQRRMAKKRRPLRGANEPGSKNYQKAKRRAAKLRRLKRRKLEHLLHTESAYYAERYGVVVVENLRIGNMTASAKGTMESPGTNVAAKAGLNRAILDSSWGRFVELLEYKLAERGGRLVKVPAQYTSQRCSACGVVDAASRRAQSRFCCTACGHEENADINAAKNIAARYTAGELPVVQPVEDPPLGAPRSRKAKP